MTVMAERTSHAAQMSVEEFERIAAFAAKDTDDAVRFEFIDGRIGVKQVPDGDHNTVVYASAVRKTFGGRLSLPEPLDVGLDTTELKRYADRAAGCPAPSPYRARADRRAAPSRAPGRPPQPAAFPAARPAPSTGTTSPQAASRTRQVRVRTGPETVASAR